MAEDPDVIARLYPAHVAGYARDIIEEHPSCVGGGQYPQLDSQSRTSRESTMEYQQSEDGGTLPYIELKFSQVPRTSLGLVFGRSARSDIVLPKLAGISSSHFALTYKNSFADGRYRLVVRDLGSTRGTMVTYDRRGDEPRKRFDWIVSGFSVPTATQTLLIQPHKWLTFRLVVFRRNLSSPSYISNVERFCKGTAAPEDLFGDLGLQPYPETERTTGAHTPLSSPILIQQDLIAQGASGVVIRYWNVSNGEEYACKQPVGKDYNKRAWEKEIDIMKQVFHVSQDPDRLHLQHCAHIRNRKTLFDSVLPSWSLSRASIWNTCHLGMSKMCTKATHSHTTSAWPSCTKACPPCCTFMIDQSHWCIKASTPATFSSSIMTPATTTSFSRSNCRTSAPLKPGV